jgi:hypothetical protein
MVAGGIGRPNVAIAEKRMAKKKITIQVDWHPSGNRTLKERIGPTGPFKDGKGPLFSNSNAAEFYRAVAKQIVKRAKHYEVAYEDDSEPLAPN